MKSKARKKNFYESYVGTVNKILSPRKAAIRLKWVFTTSHLEV